MPEWWAPFVNHDAPLSRTLTGRGLDLRVARDHDRAPITEFYRQVRAPEFTALPWPPEHLHTLLDQQQALQRRHYESAYAQQVELLVKSEQTVQGRIWLARLPGLVRIIEIVMLPARRGQGLGTDILRAIQRTAASDRLNVDLHVRGDNPAVALYTRLGFVVTATESDGTHRMIWLSSRTD